MVNSAEWRELSICDKCLWFHVNGDGDPYATEEEHEAFVANICAHLDKLGGGHVIATDEDYGFMWQSQCESCGCKLGGDRFLALLAPF